jgi:hypothetical protein
MTTAPDAKGRLVVQLTSGSGQPPRTYSGEDFPLLIAGRGTGAGTWSYHANHPQWTVRSSLSYTVRIEVRVLSY